ncbi:hypothetical protein [Streptomyces europaeiscabiei]|nr:hypothetical protein [Streptomyces europaeiscabiei]
MPVTGESEPVEVGLGSAVVGGAVSAGELLLVRVEAVGATRNSPGPPGW